MKRIVTFMMLVVFVVCISGCQDVAHERHETWDIETVESQEIDSAGAHVDSDLDTHGDFDEPKHKRTVRTVIVEEPEQIVIE
jgi:hypothetical protein